MKHVAAHLTILLGIYLFGFAAYAEHRGMIRPSWRERLNLPVYSGGMIKRTEDPKRFRELMTYQWMQAAIILGAGFIVLGISRRVERLDPLDPNFAGNSKLDELEDDLAKEQEKRRRPFR